MLMQIGLFNLTPYLPLSTNVERGTGGEVFKRQLSSSKTSATKLRTPQK
jgi:hypothetical protein